MKGLSIQSTALDTMLLTIASGFCSAFGAGAIGADSTVAKRAACAVLVEPAEKVVGAVSATTVSLGVPLESPAAVAFGAVPVEATGPRGVGVNAEVVAVGSLGLGFRSGLTAGSMAFGSVTTGSVTVGSVTAGSGGSGLGAVDGFGLPKLPLLVWARTTLGPVGRPVTLLDVSSWLEAEGVTTVVGVESSVVFGLVAGA